MIQIGLAMLLLLMYMNQSKFDDLFNKIEEGRKGENIGLSTGLPKLDKIIGGIQPSRYYVCAAASSVGKTSLMLYIMYNLLKQETEEAPIYLIYFSLEIGMDVLLAKLLALYCAEELGIYLTINDIFSLMYFCIILFIKKSPYNTVCYMVYFYANFSLAATASLSHLLFNSSSACPFTFRNSTL